MRRTVFQAVALAGGLCLAVACDSAWDPLIAHPTIVGRITAIDTTHAWLRVLVEEDPRVSEPRARGGDKIWFAVADQTPVLDARAWQAVRVDPTALESGMRVAVVTHGGIAESYPAQASADTVVIVD